MSSVKDFLAKRDLVLTGVTGYIGSHFAGALVSKGFSPVVIGRVGLAYKNLEALPPLRGQSHALRILSHDGTPMSIANGLSKLANPVVINLAGLFISSHSPENVSDLIASNIQFPTSLFEAMRLAEARCIVNVGTLWEHNDTGAYAPVNLYAATKYATQNLLEYYVQASGFNTLTLKLLDTYGRDDPRSKLVPLLRNLARSGESLKMSSGHQKINITHIDDICNALLLSAYAVAGPHSGHLVAATLSDEQFSIRELVAMIERISGRPLNTQWGAQQDSARQQPQPWAGAASPPGWSPVIGLEDGLKRYINSEEPPLEEILHV